ncbi:MAG: 3'-5' exonuclease [Bacteroidales bacterium]|nr:3'-5' exonuclease [Bacteroidales bacterium]
MENFLDQLNKQQREAVLYNEGAALVIAGAGSGKTRVLTYKIVHLLTLGYSPYSILALTFTNKAAQEMKNRIGSMVGEDLARRLWMGTFHSIFSRILRSEAEKIGFTSNFTIYDAADSKSLIKSIIKEKRLDDKLYRPGFVQARISKAKNALITPVSYAASKELVEGDQMAKTPLIRNIYEIYFDRCRNAGAMDFDDLLLYTYILFRDHSDVLEKYRNHFRYILVDEYQDTNYAQHQIVTQLAQQHQQLFVVGDDAQSIYSFRGANIDNILSFKKHYSTSKTFKLEQNYRSTQYIVEAANSLIRNNTHRIDKRIFSQNGKGDKIVVQNAYSDFEEGYIVASKIFEMRQLDHCPYRDFVILYRTNAQSRIFEEALRKRNIPYRVYGGFSFYQRKEIKDMIAYFRLLVNPHDEEAFKRIVNYPARGIGATTVNKIIECAVMHGVSLWAILLNPVGFALPVNAGTEAKLAKFRDLLLSFMERAVNLSAYDVAVMVAKESGIVAEFSSDKSVEGVSKMENLQELLNGIHEFCEMRKEEGNDATLVDFLSEVSLLTDMDDDKDADADRVTMMTVHAAKGLEFPNVFVVGMEEELFPSSMCCNSLAGIEEERRLFYVALTRAEKYCMITYARSRFRNGQSYVCTPSRFLRELDAASLQRMDGVGAFQMPQAQPHSFIKPVTETKTEPFAHTPKWKKVSEVVNQSSQDVTFTPLAVGNKILHDRFGEGDVTAIDGEGNNTKATVVFKSVGQKQLLLKFAKYKIIS